ncbi:LPS translocon maturation chaperone LptM [Roseibium sp.]|uniref:LPS translocon maturation chaperone LptM n=1 Tax=Roseibium sp. TaxID=1936156 RepID=UPI003A96DD3C
MVIDLKALNFGVKPATVISLCAVMALTVVLSGCGRRGSLETPSASAPAADPAVAASPAATGAPQESAEPTPQKSGFFLDFLI